MADSGSIGVSHGRVLVLDDDEVMCRFLEVSLARRGFAVVSETSPADALELLASERFDVVLSDLNMEGLDGLSFTRAVIALGRDLPVILMTGSATIELAIEAVHAGAWEFLAKPLDQRKLAASMERARLHWNLKRELRDLREQANAAG